MQLSYLGPLYCTSHHETAENSGDVVKDAGGATYKLGVVDVAPEPHGHLGAGAVSFPILVLPISSLLLRLLLHLTFHRDVRGRSRRRRRARVPLLGGDLPRLLLDRAGGGGGRVSDGHRLRQLFYGSNSVTVNILTGS